MAAYLLSLRPGTISLILSYLTKAGDDDNSSSDIDSDDSTVIKRDEFGIDHRSLARVARTCRQLWEPAVAILWWEIPTFTPILRTLPANVYALGAVHHAESETEAGPSRNLLRLLINQFSTTVEFKSTEPAFPVGSQEMRLLRTPQLQDFRRWALYSQYIRVVQSDPKTVSRGLARIFCSLDVWTLLTRHGPIPLFPNEPRQLHLLAIPPQAGFAGTFHRLAVCASQLEELTITENSSRDPHDVDAGINLSLASFIPSLSRLRILRIERVHVFPAALSAIGSLRSLEHLSIEISSKACPPSRLRISPWSFPLIRELSVIVDDLRWVTAFLDHMSSPWLECLSILFRGRHLPPHYVDALYCAVASGHWQFSFQRMMLRCLSVQPPCVRGRRLDSHFRITSQARIS
ncbi:hypothetical protein C8T65DRAFT_738298 [Cerioporus squamosus]|nr:hypothetical protein C8T65DRAFT_738298 [Cerioporus squamosus]